MHDQGMVGPCGGGLIASKVSRGAELNRGSGKYGFLDSGMSSLGCPSSCC